MTLRSLPRLLPSEILARNREAFLPLGDDLRARIAILNDTRGIDALSLCDLRRLPHLSIEARVELLSRSALLPTSAACAVELALLREMGGRGGTAPLLLEGTGLSLEDAFRFGLYRATLAAAGHQADPHTIEHFARLLGFNASFTIIRRALRAWLGKSNPVAQPRPTGSPAVAGRRGAVARGRGVSGNRAPRCRAARARS